MDYPHDQRAISMLGGFGPHGEALPVTRQHMVDEAARWPVSPHTSREVSDQLRVARDLFVHCLLVWEFGAVGAAWSLMAVESCLRWALDAGDKVPFKALSERARDEGLLSDALFDKVDAGRQLRNMFSHPSSQPAWPLGMTGGALETSHVVVHAVSEVTARIGSPDGTLMGTSSPEDRAP